MIRFNFVLLMVILLSCSASQTEPVIPTDQFGESTIERDSLLLDAPLFCNADVKVGAENTAAYFDLIHDKKIGVVGNQSSMIGAVHLVDTLLGAGMDIVRVFSPEHGFRGTADAGEKVDSEIDQKTGLPIVSLYGKNKKPSASQLAGIDVLIFDIQDVGVRFYTYISTLHYVMEAAAENNIQLIVLDRPNPNGHYVDGPVLKEGFTSFVGMHKVPVVHGMTIAEYAQMINGEGWLSGGLVCDLTVVECEGWDHTKFYQLPIAPSPNLPNMTAVYLYPSLCFFEGTIVSIGRGTDWPFQVIGHPGYANDVEKDLFEFIPAPNFGAKHPVLEGETCYGFDLHESSIKSLQEKATLDLSYLIDFYQHVKASQSFFLPTNFIDLLAGSDLLRKQLSEGLDLATIRATWQADLEVFLLMRANYLLY